MAIVADMIDRVDGLNSASGAINAQSLQAARSAIAEGAGEYMCWAEIFSQRLQTVEPADLHKFARALALTMLGHLPTRPTTCPFCIQYGMDRSCKGCGYALTHGRCDSEQSAFSRFIEAFVELGRAIYQDTTQHPLDPDQARSLLQTSLSSSREAAMQMLEGLPSVSARTLMERKAWYLDRMIALIPLSIFSDEVEVRSLEVRDALKDYW